MEMTVEVIAKYLDLDPRSPLYWPVFTLRRLQRIETESHDEFLRQLHCMMNNKAHGSLRLVEIHRRQQHI